MNNDMNIDEQPFENCQRQEKKPVIDHLENAIIVSNGVHRLNVDVNDRIIIERSLAYDDGPHWFDTRLYEIKKIDESGAMRLWDIENSQFAASNWQTLATHPLYRVKVSLKHSTKLSRRRKKNVEVVEQKPTKKKRVMSGGTTNRKIYDSRGTIHLRIRGQAYSFEGNTKAHAGDSLDVVINDDGTINVKDSFQGWVETWKKIPL